MSVDLAVDFCGIKLENPFILAPSPSTDHLDLLIEAFDAGWAGAVLKTVAVDSSIVSRVFPLVMSIEQESAFIGQGVFKLFFKSVPKSVMAAGFA